METVSQINQSVRRIPPALVVALLSVVALFIFAPPFSFEVKAKAVAYGICHQIPARSLFVAGHPLPLCARNTGIFLGSLVTFAGLYLTGRGRASAFPPVRVLVALGLFTAIAGVDGVNSYLGFFPGLPQLYEPSNFLRLTTGAFHGITMAAILFPIFNSVLWQEPSPRRVVAGFRELALFVASIIVLIALVYARLDFLYFPIAGLMALAVLVMVAMANGTLILMALKWENAATGWRNAAPLLLVALVAALIELALLGALRTQLTTVLSLPF